VNKTLRGFLSLLELWKVYRPAREIKKFEDWLSENSTLPHKFENASDMSSVLKAGVMSSVPLSFLSSQWCQRNGFYWFSFFT
jgi:hypothetical protein